ncbi:MAG: histidinol-phosphatase [Alphaproteobacteria bacterium]|nr:histidinol-phosphatase [Alphaproteobacteria bacterium]MDE2630220.1 histidinol-phosphatase [Alphaproteobacteria bacterium]
MPIADDIAFAHKLADAAGEVIRPYFRKRIEVIDKGVAMFDPVTAADKRAEEAIRTLIKAERPQDGILGEEYGEEPGTSGRVWVLDPVDGTRAFITGQMQWGTLIALNEDSAPALGILDQPVLRERFVGTAGGAFLHAPQGKSRLAVRPCAGLAEAVLMTTDPWSYFNESEQEAFRALSQACLLTRFGGDCYAYGLLAMGFADVIVEDRLKPWDIQALIPIVEAAGGVVTDWRGRPCPDGGRVIAAGDARVHAQALKFLAG